jgi:hypothetical protein
MKPWLFALGISVIFAIALRTTFRGARNTPPLDDMSSSFGIGGFYIQNNTYVPPIWAVSSHKGSKTLSLLRHAAR